MRRTPLRLNITLDTILTQQIGGTLAVEDVKHHFPHRLDTDALLPQAPPYQVKLLPPLVLSPLALRLAVSTLRIAGTYTRFNRLVGPEFHLPDG